MKINSFLPQEEEYFKRLLDIAVKPKMLYYMGKMIRLEEFAGIRPKTVAIVGTRKATKYGLDIAYDLAFRLARRGAVIVSGLATGIDAAAHEGALAGEGRTLAVLGTEIEKIYPAMNRGLAEEILEKQGMIISEYKLGMQIFPKVSFLERNRLISGMSDIVIVVEAARKSGSLNTAMHALEQGRDLWVVMRDINRPMSEGSNRLIRQGANPIVSVEEFVEEVMPERGGRKVRRDKGENELEEGILLMIENGVYDGEEIVQRLGVSATDFNIAITMMEIRGLVRGLGGNQWMIA